MYLGHRGVYDHQIRSADSDKPESAPDPRFREAVRLLARHGDVPIGDLDRALRPLTVRHLIEYLQRENPNARVDVADGKVTYIGWVPDFGGPVTPN